MRFAVHKVQEVLTLNKPAYLGICVLDSSKILIYDLNYSCIRKKRGHRAKHLFTYRAG